MIGISVMQLHSPDLNTNLNSPPISPRPPILQKLGTFGIFATFRMFQICKQILSIATEFDTNVKSLAISVALPPNGSCLNAWS